MRATNAIDAGKILSGNLARDIYCLWLSDPCSGHIDRCVAAVIVQKAMNSWITGALIIPDNLPQIIQIWIFRGSAARYVNCRIATIAVKKNFAPDIPDLIVSDDLTQSLIANGRSEVLPETFIVL